MSKYTHILYEYIFEEIFFFYSECPHTICVSALGSRDDLQRIPLDIEILSNLRFGSLEKNIAESRLGHLLRPWPEVARGGPSLQACLHPCFIALLDMSSGVPQTAYPNVWEWKAR